MTESNFVTVLNDYKKLDNDVRKLFFKCRYGLHNGQETDYRISIKDWFIKPSKNPLSGEDSFNICYNVVKKYHNTEWVSYDEIPLFLYQYINDEKKLMEMTQTWWEKEANKIR